MKKEYFIVIMAFIFGLLVWIFDSAIDSLFFYEDSFFNLVIAKIPKPELFFRSQVIIFFTIFGIIISRIFSRQKKTEESLLRVQNELERRVEERTAKLSESNELLNAEIVERVRAEKGLRHNQKMLRTIFDGIIDPLVLLGEDMRVKIINKAAAEYYGLSEDLVIYETKCHQMLRDSATPCQGCEVPRAISKGKSVQFERKGFMTSERLEKVYLYPVKNEDTNAWDTIIRISDITEQRLLEKQIIQQEKLASLGVMVSSMAHEINNPNNFISFNIPILRNYVEEIMPIVDKYAGEHPEIEICNMSYSDFREDIFKLLDNVEHGSCRISSLVSNLKDFSQPKNRIQEQWIDLKPIIENVISLFRSQLGERSKIFTATIPVNLPQVWSDSYALEQILINLLVNAKQALENTDSKIELSVEVHSNWLNHIILKVKDDGCGMNEKTIQKIFDPFFTTKHHAGGTGLGLYVTQNLVKSLGGRIEVESKPSKGSIFKVILPDRKRRRSKRL
jgi:signal transduction histidine kinase